MLPIDGAIAFGLYNVPHALACISPFDTLVLHIRPV